MHEIPRTNHDTVTTGMNCCCRLSQAVVRTRAVIALVVQKKCYCSTYSSSNQVLQHSHRSAGLCSSSTSTRSRLYMYIAASYCSFVFVQPKISKLQYHR